jgi:hypothetical protein
MQTEGRQRIEEGTGHWQVLHLFECQIGKKLAKSSQDE